jgi:large subunit ribosomal protein L23
MKVHNIILAPVITEQSMGEATDGKYTFAVARQATKTQIKKAVSDTFSVQVVSVATTVVKGKTKRVGPKRQEIKESIWKKAIVIVKKGEKIGLFEPGVNNTDK